jgi:hypothetical protein
VPPECPRRERPARLRPRRDRRCAGLLRSAGAAEALLQGHRNLKALNGIDVDDVTLLREVLRVEHLPALVALPEAMKHVCAVFVAATQMLVRPAPHAPHCPGGRLRAAPACWLAARTC